ncbi:hypothetical protein BegalDRAFT_1523 [Beggiatoa alba B18LD]|uniref:Yip1 domain-containing protein n=1 Tax=Beggiatoa alba B18LD TaxID=395493 RepID=I3CFL2_9GAMM|nr:hypothetical protein [Beggiatoa alba]EIJ42405.1 hypothetical protein BegalDRAFT_1523 [Beggiatoa alba B18LD]
MTNTLLQLGLLFFNLCRFRIAPQHLPYSPVLLWGCMLCYVLLNIPLLAMQLDFPTALLLSLLEIALLAFVVASLLYIVKLLPRFVQTLTAIAGTGSLFGLLGMPISLFIYVQQSNNEPVEFSAIILTALVIWQLAIYIHIFRHALNLTIFFSVIVTFVVLSLVATLLGQITALL